MTTAVVIIVLLGLILALYLTLNPQFGGRYARRYASVFQNSSQWSGKNFENQSLTTMNISLKTIPSLLKQQFTDRASRAPKKNIPIIPFQATTWNDDQETPKFIWYGHSVLLMQLHGKNILIDPMLGPNASPIGPISTKRFSDDALGVIDQLPEIDLVLITHDHYDHLDYHSMKKLIPKVKNFYVALGVGRHLERWGAEKASITEFDWWNDAQFEGIKITFTPSRHFSGRGLFDRTKSLWGGWVFQTPEFQIYWSGDGGYDKHFKEIGKKFGPFDWAFMECGQYNEHWHLIHMFPEESVQAALDVHAKVAIPVHWGGFVLALHSWTDPVERFVKSAEENQLQVLTPSIGEIVSMKDQNTNFWWETI